jgi:hypothetical protein
MSHLLTTDKEHFTKIRNFTTSPGQTIIYRGRTWGGPVQTSRKRPDTFHFIADEHIEVPGAACILDSNGTLYFVTLLSSHSTLQKAADYYGEIDEQRKLEGEERAELDKIFKTNE